MNEQIEKLFDQALEEFKVENEYATIVVPDPLQRDFVEKFAKSIVRECLQYLRDEAERLYTLEDEDADMLAEKCYDNIQGLQDHFGVEL